MGVPRLRTEVLISPNALLTTLALSLEKVGMVLGKHLVSASLTIKGLTAKIISSNAVSVQQLSPFRTAGPYGMAVAMNDPALLASRPVQGV